MWSPLERSLKKRRGEQEPLLCIICPLVLVDTSTNCVSFLMLSKLLLSMIKWNRNSGEVKRNGWKEIWGRKHRAVLRWEVGSGQMVSVSLHVRNEWLGGIHQPGALARAWVYKFCASTNQHLVGGMWGQVMSTGIQSRACGLNIKFHIELWGLFVCFLKKVILYHSKTQRAGSTRPRLEYA